MMLTSISLWPLVRQTTPQIITIFSHISKLCITCFGTSALITCPCLLSRGPWNLWALHSGHSEHQFLFSWLGSLDFSPFVMSAKFPLFPPKAEAHRIGPGWIQNGDQLEKNSISSQLDWCTALHHIQRVSTIWCWVPRVSACISNNASLCQMERTQIVQKRETQYLSSISFSELVGKQEGCREISFAPTTVTAETSQTIKSS